MRSFLFVIILSLSFALAKAQNSTSKTNDTLNQKVDTLESPAYVNKGKIAGRKAFRRSLIFPGLGQMFNYGLYVNDAKETGKKQVFNKVYTIAKIAGIYTAGTLLVMAYIDNNNSYKIFLTELQYRDLNKTIDPDSKIANNSSYDVSTLTLAKNIFKRNREVVLISMVGLYGAAALEAYVAARLKFFNINETLSFKVAPSTINSNTMYGYHAAPAIKLTLKL